MTFISEIAEDFVYQNKDENQERIQQPVKLTPKSNNYNLQMTFVQQSRKTIRLY